MRWILFLLLCGGCIDFDRLADLYPPDQGVSADGP
jgi:hypothetical protein